MGDAQAGDAAPCWRVHRWGRGRVGQQHADGRSTAPQLTMLGVVPTHRPRTPSLRTTRASTANGPPWVPPPFCMCVFTRSVGLLMPARVQGGEGSEGGEAEHGLPAEPPSSKQG